MQESKEFDKYRKNALCDAHVLNDCLTRKKYSDDEQHFFPASAQQRRKHLDSAGTDPYLKQLCRQRDTEQETADHSDNTA